MVLTGFYWVRLLFSFHSAPSSRVPEFQRECPSTDWVGHVPLLLALSAKLTIWLEKKRNVLPFFLFLFACFLWFFLGVFFFWGRTNSLTSPVDTRLSPQHTGGGAGGPAVVLVRPIKTRRTWTGGGGVGGWEPRARARSARHQRLINPKLLASEPQLNPPLHPCGPPPPPTHPLHSRSIKRVPPAATKQSH